MYKVAYFSPTDGGCDYYRGILPLTKAKEKKSIETHIVRPHNFIMDQRYKKDKFDEYMSSDVIIIPRSMEYKLFDEIKEYSRSLNPRSKIGVEYDDNLFNVSPMSPHYADHGIEDVQIIMPDGKKMDVWKNGINLDIEQNKKKMAEVKRTMKDADFLTTTTDILADVFKEYNDNVKILPNCVDMRRWKRIEMIRPKDEVRLFWAGGQSHYEDWYQIKDAIRVVMNRYKNLKLILMGCKWDATLKGVDMKRVEFHEWEDTSAYPYKVNLINPDIGLIPLRDTDFNRCKSAIKWIELGAMEVPCVATYIPPYAPMEKLEKDNGIFVEANDSDGWIKGISYLVENTEMRKKMGLRAYRTVFNNFDINTQYVQWVDVIKEAMEWQPQATQLLQK